MGRRDRLGVVIGVGNQKGGVGKTTNTVHLAAALGLRGYRSLIIDLDPSAGATRHLGISENCFAGTLELLAGGEELEELVLTRDLPRGVHLIPSRLELTDLENHLPKFTDRTRILDGPVQQARQRYDFVFLDTRPDPGAATTIAAYITADWFLLSVFPQHLAIRSLSESLKDIADVRAQRNPHLEVLGVVLTCVDGRATRSKHRTEELIGAALPGRLCENFTSQATDVPAVAGKGKTLFQIRRLADHPVARQYRRLAAELEHRMLNRPEFLRGELEPPDYEEVLAEEIAHILPELSIQAVDVSRLAPARTGS